MSPPLPGDESTDTSITARTSSPISETRVKKTTRRKKRNHNHIERSHRRRRSARLRASDVVGDESDGQRSFRSSDIEPEIINLEDETGGQSPCSGTVSNQTTLNANSPAQDELPSEEDLLPHLSSFQPVFTPVEDYGTSNFNVIDQWENIDHDFLSDTFAWPEDNITEDVSSLRSEALEASCNAGMITQQEKTEQPTSVAQAERSSQAERPSQAHIIRALALQWTFACGFLSCPAKESAFGILKPQKEYLLRP